MRSFESSQQCNYSETGIYVETKQESLPNDENAKLQQYCSFCKRVAIKPISLICNHNLCLTCANFLKEHESGSGIQVRFKISCPSCEVKTVTYNVNNLITQNGSSKKSSNSLQILSQQASPSKKNSKNQTLSKNKLSSSLLNSSKIPVPTNTIESYHPGYIKQLQNQSWNSQENINHTQNTINQTMGYALQGQVDKSLEYSTLENRNNSLEATFSNQKNTNASMVTISSISALNSTSNQYNSNILQNRNSYSSLFFTPNQNKQLSSNNLSKCTMSTTQTYNNSNFNNNCQTIQEYPTNSSSENIIKKQQMNFTRNSKQNNSEQCSNNISEQLICHFHNEQLSLFCITDKTLLCVECLYSTKQHKSHNIIPLKNAQQMLKKENEEFKNQYEEQMKKLETSLQISMQNKNFLSIEYSKNFQKIHEIFDNMIEIINTKRNKLLEQIEQYYEIHMKEVNFNTSELANIKGILEEYKDFDQKVVENQLSDSYIFSAFKMIKQQLEQTNIDIKPLKNEFSIMQIENSHKILFNKLVDKIVQISNQKVESNNQTKHAQLNQGYLVQNQKQQSNANKTLTQKQIQQQAYTPSQHKKKDITPKKEFNHSYLQNSNGKSQNLNIPLGQTSQQASQRGNNKKSTVSFSEQVQKRLSTQACQKTSYKNLKRKLSTDFHPRNNSKENIQYIQQAQPYFMENNQCQLQEKKRSFSIQGDFNYNPNHLQVTYNDQQDTEQSQNLKIMNANNLYENLQTNISQEKLNQYKMYNKNIKISDTINNNLNRSPFKEYIIN